MEKKNVDVDKLNFKQRLILKSMTKLHKLNTDGVNLFKFYIQMMNVELCSDCKSILSKEIDRIGEFNTPPKIIIDGIAKNLCSDCWKKSKNIMIRYYNI